MTCRACASREQWRARFQEILEGWLLEFTLRPRGQSLHDLVEQWVDAVCDDEEWSDDPESL